MNRRALFGLLSAALLTACAGPPARVEGNYTGFVGGEYSSKKIGMKVNFTQKDTVILGKGEVTYDAMNLMLTQQEVRELQQDIADGNNRQTTFTTGFESTGSVKGQKVNFELVAAEPARFRIKFHGTYSDASQGGPKIGGECEVIREGKTVDKRPFTLRPI